MESLGDRPPPCEGGSTHLSTLQDSNAESTDALCTHGSQAEAEAALNHYEPLPPKKLERDTTRQLRKRNLELLLLYSILAVVVAVLIFTSQASWSSRLKFDGSEDGNACVESFNSRSEAERLFQLNVHAIRGLSFTRAKLIDLLWDTVVGQGGRFIHGLVLHQLVSRALTLLMERSVLPYSFLIPVRFSTVSIESLWSCCRILFVTKPIRTTAITIGLLFTIGHVLAFATFWSAATGYEAETVPAYEIAAPGTFISKESEQLTLCWSVPNLDRVGPYLNKTIIGPTFSRAYGSWENIGDKKEFERLRMRSKSPLVDTSEDFQNIYAYAIAKETFFSRYNSTAFSEQAKVIGRDTWYDSCGYNGSETANGYKFYETCTYDLYSSVDGWQFAGFGQKEQENLPPDWRNETNLEDPGHPMPADSDYVPYRATFLLDADTSMGDFVVPYNSTIWWNDTRIMLNAPFLDIGSDCRWFEGSLGVCLCLDGDVLREDFRRNPKTCLNSTGYSWGLSSFVVLVGLLLETTWLLTCGLMWFLIMANSELVKAHRPGTGVIRAVIDIAGAISLSLGTDVGAYTDKELKKELEKRHPVGYGLNDHEEATYPRIQLSPMLNGMRVRPKMRLDNETIYK
ncbi:hypothetical protein HD806DRAFT_543936 [Xylariaceae sp. AK1471]|nr:hypothetical protein HD806DRAFT_543936 [Xylariaceae sp. AK1471]